jgi:hypothetical protein
MIFLYKIKLSDRKNIDAFIKIMNVEYISSIHKGPTWVCEVTDVQLLDNNQNEAEFLWYLDWNDMLDRSSMLSESLLKNYNYSLEFIGSYSEAFTY